jgi:hypothetical protein
MAEQHLLDKLIARMPAHPFASECLRTLKIALIQGDTSREIVTGQETKGVAQTPCSFHSSGTVSCYLGDVPMHQHILPAPDRHTADNPIVAPLGGMLDHTGKVRHEPFPRRVVVGEHISEDTVGYALSEAETRRFLATVGDHRLYALYCVVLRTGMRMSEPIGLRRVNVLLVEKDGKKPLGTKNAANVAVLPRLNAGGPGGDRTHDHRFKRPLLYR